MKNIFRFRAPVRKRKGKDQEPKLGWIVKTQWRGKVRFKRFWDHIEGSDVEALGAAIDWLTQQNKQLGKPHDVRHIRSSGTYVTRTGKRGTWRR